MQLQCLESSFTAQRAIIWLAWCRNRHAAVIVRGGGIFTFADDAEAEAFRAFFRKSIHYAPRIVDLATSSRPVSRVIP